MNVTVNYVVGTVFLIGILSIQAAIAAMMLGWNPLTEGHAESHEKFVWYDSYGKYHTGTSYDRKNVEECKVPIEHGLRCVIEDL